MSNVITYLFIGLIWDAILSFITLITESKHKLSNYERVFSLVLWPFTLITFVYHFIKTTLNGNR